MFEKIFAKRRILFRAGLVPVILAALYRAWSSLSDIMAIAGGDVSGYASVGSAHLVCGELAQIVLDAVLIAICVALIRKTANKQV